MIFRISTIPLYFQIFQHFCVFLVTSKLPISFKPSIEEDSFRILVFKEKFFFVTHHIPKNNVEF